MTVKPKWRRREWAGLTIMGNCFLAKHIYDYTMEMPLADSPSPVRIRVYQGVQRFPMMQRMWSTYLRTGEDDRVLSWNTEVGEIIFINEIN